MNNKELKKLLLESLNAEEDVSSLPAMLEEKGVSYDFSDEFYDKIQAKLISQQPDNVKEMDFTRSLNLVFYRIALTGVAAIVLLLFSIFLSEGSLSINSFLGLTDTYDESIVCMLTGN